MYLNGESPSSYGQILFYKNGKYAIEIDSVIYSEGLWSAASVDSDGFPQLEHEGNVIYLTEYIYRSATGSSNPVIIDEPVTKKVTVTSTSPRGLTNFTSASGAVYLFSET